MCVAKSKRLFVARTATTIMLTLALSGAARGEEELRTWTDRANTRQAQAQLVSVEGSDIRLRSATGTRLRTTIDALSESDQRYIQQFVTRGSAPAGTMPVVRGLLNKLPGVPGAVAKLTDKGPDSVGGDSPGVFGPLMRPLPEKLPADLIYVRLSKDFLEDFVEEDIDREQFIQDEILGTSIRGRAHTRGKTTLVLHPSDETAIAEVVFKGTVHSRTIGYNGPVRLHCTSNTPFESRKRIYFGPQGIQALTSNSTARTQSQTTKIEATLPGLRGRIAERVAWNRSGQMKLQADAIASRHTEQRLNAEFDRQVDASIAEATSDLLGKFEQLPTTGAELPTEMTCRSTPDYLEIVLSNSDAPAASEGPQPVYKESAKIAVRVHRAVLRSAISDPQVQRALQPLLLGLTLSETSDSTLKTVSATRPESPEFYLSWSDDQEWLEIDLGRTEKLVAPAKTVVAER